LKRFHPFTWIFLVLYLAGCVISPRRTSVSSGGGGGGINGKLYVTNDSANSIVRFDNAFTANNNVTPAAVISGASTQLSNPQYIFLDASSDRLFVANANGSDILIFDTVSTKTNNVAPTRVISSASLATPTDVALDKGRDLLYVADTNVVLVFAAASTANGVTVPVRTLNTGFTPGAILIDAANDRLFVADPVTNSINIFDGASTLSGTVLVTRRLVGSNTQLAQPFGLQIDPAQRLVVSNFAPPSITIYSNAATTNGNIAPVATISGSNTTLAGPTQITINTVASGGELFVADPFGGNVPVFGSIGSVTGNQNIAPTRNITGSNTTLTGTTSATARGVAIDTTR
jgi:6-phosphogluconolactonase (cycloisomerase 2 family)